jgi:DNA polymerase-1
MTGALDGVQLHMVKSSDDLAACRQWAFSRREGPLFFDTESAGLNPHRDAHRLTQLGDLNAGWAFPGSWAGAATEILASYPGELGAHNSPYDWRVLQLHQGMTPLWHKTNDTLISSHIADSVRVAALKPRAAIDIDTRAVAGEKILEDAMRKQGWTWGTVPENFEPWWMYGALDPVLAAHLWRKHSPEVLGRFGPVYDLERATARICAGMMTAGMKIDVPFIREKIAKIESYLARARPWLAGEFGIRSVNSNDQVGRALNDVGIPTLVFTDGGLPSISKDTLRLYRNMYPGHAALIDAIGWCRKGESIIGRYLEKFLAMRDGDDVIHCQIWTSRARTSRMSVTDPPMQTYDRDEPIIRGAFVPREGHVFITIDADQIEARMTAHFTGDRQMIADFHEADRMKVGFFIIMASKIFGEQIAKKDPRYTRTKNATYGQIYGAGLAKSAATAGVPVEQMEPVYYGTQALYPGISALMNKLIRQGKESRGRPQVYSLLGRRLYADRGHEYALLNYDVQCSAAEVMKTGQVRLDAAGFGPYLRLDIHDEILMEVPREWAKDMLAEATRILTDRESFAVPITWAGSILEDRWRKT